MVQLAKKRNSSGKSICSFITSMVLQVFFLLLTTGTVSAASVTSITATPDSFNEGASSTITLSATITGDLSNYTWVQTGGPKVPLTATSESAASADVSGLSVAVDTGLTFSLTVTGTDGTVDSLSTTVVVYPVDMTPIRGPNVQIGGSSTCISTYEYSGTKWAFFNIGNRFLATPVSSVKGPVHSIYVQDFINDIDIITYNGIIYALLSTGTSGIVAVDISNPSAMTIYRSAAVNYYQDGITFTEGGGTILTDNIISSTSAPVAALATDGIDLYIADPEFGIHKTALDNLLNPTGAVLESDGTLLIDREKYTLQYAGENPWGGPVDLLYYGGKLFVCMKELGLGIFDTATLEQVGRYNLYTDPYMYEDWFISMNVEDEVQFDIITGDPFIDDFTGMPDYRQTSFELLTVMKKKSTDPTPWADFDRYGKYYYKARSVDIAEFNGRTIAYIAYSLGGLIAVDITGYQDADAVSFLNGKYLGYFPAVPANGPDEPTGIKTKSILPYKGAGMLKESGVVDVKIKGTNVYATDHFAGLVIVSNAGTPDLSWHGSDSPYDNDTDGILGNHWPDYEFVTSYDMTAWDPTDNESMPVWYYHSPALLVTAEINGHGNRLSLMDDMDITSAGEVDILECAGAGGFNFIDIVNLGAFAMEDKYTVPVYFPTTEEIGAAPDGSPTATISIGHSGGIDSSGSYVYVSDGPHGISAWKTVDENGYPTDNIHLVANTLQDEYPAIVNGVKIYPASHATNVVFDPVNNVAWSGSASLGLRRVDVNKVESGLGAAGTPLLLPLQLTDCFEHNAEWGTVKPVQYQDHAYDVALSGNYAFVADGSNGLTVYDISKEPTGASTGFFVSNIGSGKKKPALGRAQGIVLWTDPLTGNRYAFTASGPYGVGVVDVTDVMNMKLVKVFEPIKMEDGKVGAADGQAIDVKVVENYAYFSYDSFGVVSYLIEDLIEPLPPGIDPTQVWKVRSSGTLLYDYRPEAAGRFKLQYIPGFEEQAGGAVKMATNLVNGKLVIYAAFGEAGVVAINWTDPANPVLDNIVSTSGFCTAVTLSNGRLYAADGNGGLVFFK